MKAFVGIFLSYVILMILLTFLFIVGLPLLKNFVLSLKDIAPNVYAYTPSDEFSKNIVEQGKKSIIENTNVLSVFIQYSWVIIILVVVVALFIFSRRLSEYGQAI